MRRPTVAVDAAFLLLVVALPLAWSPLFIAEFTLAKFAALNAALALAAWGAAARPGALAAGRGVLDLPLAACLLAAGLSAAASADPATSLRGRYDSYAYGLWGLCLLAACAQLAGRSARGREAERASWMVWSAALVAGYAIAQKLGFDPIFRLKALPAGGRAVSTLGSPVDLGAFLALLLPPALRLADGRRRAGFIAAALIAGGLLASGSRGAMLAASVGAAAYWLLSRRRALLPSAGVAAAAAGAAIAWTFRPGASIVDAARREVWKSALAAFARSPWLGTGLDGFEDALRRLRTAEFTALMGSSHHQAYPHNDLLQALSGLGLPGAAAYAWLLWSAARAARRALDPEASRPLAAALAAGLLALWVNLALNPVSLEVLAFAAVAAGLLASLGEAAPSAPLPRLPLLALAALATASLAGALGLARADAVFKAGARAQAAGDFAAARREFARARAAAPCELSYILGEVNAIGDWINATRVVDERLALLALAEKDGRVAVSCHPRQSTAHYIAGAAARMHADLGFRDQLPVAARELDAALELDPRFGPLLAARLEVARLMGDASRIAELERRTKTP